MIPSGYGRFDVFRSLVTPHPELHLSQRLFAFEHVHVGYRLLPVCANIPICSGFVSHDRFSCLT